MKRNFDHSFRAPVFRIYIAISLLIYTNLLSAASTYHSHDSIIDEVRLFALAYHKSAEKVEVTVNPIDNRLKLPDCPINLSVFWPTGSTHLGSATIGVHCDSPQPWKIYVRANISVYDEVLILTAPVNPGDLLSAENVHPSLINLAGFRGDVVTDISKVIDYRFKRRVSKGRPLTKSMLAAPNWISKGDDIVILSIVPNLMVRMKGIALADGERGAKIRVRNSSSKRIIQGQVVAQGTVQVAP